MQHSEHDGGWLGPDSAVVTLGVAFCLVYLAFNGAQNLQTSSTQTIGGIKLGDWSLGGLYLANTFSGLSIAVPATSWTTDRNAVIYWIGAVPLFIVGNVLYPEYTLLPTSVIAGLSAGVQWTGAWGYISSCISWKGTTKNAAFLTGVFYGIMQSSQILGNLASSLMLHHIGRTSGDSHSNETDSSSSGDGTSSEGRRWLAVVYVASCALGMGLLFALPNLKREVAPLQMSTSEKITGMAKLVWNDTRMMLMVLMFVYSGYTQNYFFGVFTAQITDENGESDEDVGYVMAWFGFSDAILSFLLGWLGSKIGGGQVIFFASLSCIGGVVMLMTLLNHHTIYTLSVVALLFGAADAGYNAILVATLSRMYPKTGGSSVEMHNSACAFASFQFFQSGVTAVAFFYQNYVSLWGKTIIFCSSLGLAMMSYVILSLKYMSHKEDDDEVEYGQNESKSILNEKAADRGSYGIGVE